ncbi:hypothetical protein VTK56DRAFT_4605 [Thermocarpiscus australiensis]
MRISDTLSLLLAAAGTQIAAQTSSSSSASPSSTVTPGGPVTGQLGNATVVTNNPPGVVYKATLPESAFFEPAYPNGGNIKGEVTAVANPLGRGVLFTVKLSNLPQIGSNLTYHLHVAPVPEDGNCTSTLAHLDPFIRGEDPPCDAQLPETCQVGDLSGKHGSIPTDQGSFEASYVDLYASTLEGIGAFFGNRSVVIHYPNKTRITCANFEKVEDGSDSCSASGSGSGSGSGSSTPVLLPTSTAGPIGGGGGGGNSTVLPTGGVPTTTGPAATTSSTVVFGAASRLGAGIAGAVVFGAAVMFML